MSIPNYQQFKHRSKSKRTTYSSHKISSWSRTKTWPQWDTTSHSLGQLLLNNNNNKYWWECREIRRTLVYCWWEYKMVSLLWKTVGWFLRRSTILWLYDPAIPHLDVQPEKLKARTQKDACTPMFKAAFYS